MRIPASWLRTQRSVQGVVGKVTEMKTVRVSQVELCSQWRGPFLGILTLKSVHPGQSITYLELVPDELREDSGID